jgi:hypothetical protein
MPPMIEAYDLPDGEFDHDLQMYRANGGDLFAPLGQQYVDGEWGDFYRPLTVDEDHAVWMATVTDYDRRADYADREAA